MMRQIWGRAVQIARILASNGVVIGVRPVVVEKEVLTGETI
jgi:predicted nuclease with RNAse H fold